MIAQPLTLTDEDLDHMHHALGRPDGEWVTPYRNYYSCAADGADAYRFQALASYWTLGRLINGGRDAVYDVTPFGQREVVAWVAAKRSAKGLRVFRVGGGGLSPKVVVARSRAAARYAVWLEVSDVWPVSYAEFLRRDVRAVIAHG